jgi:hypothetical protein
MTLVTSYARIAAQLSRRQKQATEILDDHQKGELSPWEFRFLAEGLVSNLWQDWNSFVKQVLILSCNGPITRSGIIFPPRAVLDNSENRITYEVGQYSKGNTANATKIFSGAIEPTWAHPDRIISCINGLAPLNILPLQMAFGSAGLVGPKRIHLVRNASAHKTRSNRQDVQTLRAIYRTKHFLDPIDIIWGSNPTTNSIAVFEWISDLEDIADLATQ